MTNIKKYLKEDVDVEELKKDFFDYLVSDGVYGCNSKNIVQKWEDFLNMPATPKLTEDERVILRNMEKGSTIGRRNNKLYVYSLELFPNLFQFIQERRRI